MDEQTVVSGKCSGSWSITASSSCEKLYFSSDRPLLPNLHDHQILVLHGLAEVSQLLYILYRIPKTNICKLCWKPFLSITKKYFPFWSQGLLTPCTIHLEKTTMILSWTSWSTGWSNLALQSKCGIWNPPPSPSNLDFSPQTLPSWDEHRGQHQTSASPSQGRFLGPGLHFSTFFLPATGNSWGYLGSDFYLVVALFSFAKSVIS